MCTRIRAIPEFDQVPCSLYTLGPVASDFGSAIPSQDPTPPPYEPVTFDSEESETIIDNRGMFRRPFSGKGRIRRLEFGISCILYFVAYLIVDHLAESSKSNMALVALMIWLPSYWFLIAQGVKRCHDLGHSGWWQIIPFYYIAMLFFDGDIYTNEYGNDPKGRDE